MTRYYYLDVTTNCDCQIALTVNGFPILFGNIYKNITFPTILNEYLVKGDNEFVMEWLPNNNFTEQIEINVIADLRIFKEGEIVTPEDGESVEFTQIYPENSNNEPLQVIKTQFRQTSKTERVTRFAYKFYSEEYDFSSLLKGSSLNITKEELLAYALKLIDLFQAKDVERFFVECLPKTQDAINAFGKSETEYYSQSKELDAAAMALGLARVPKQAEIGVRSWCNGRIYELYIKPNYSLISTNQDNDGVMELHVFVSMINGSLKIVR